MISEMLKNLLADIRKEEGPAGKNLKTLDLNNYPSIPSEMSFGGQSIIEFQEMKAPKSKRHDFIDPNPDLRELKGVGSDELITAANMKFKIGTI